MMAHLKDMLENHFENIRRGKLTEHYHERISDDQFVEQLKALRAMEESIYTLLKQAEELLDGE